MSRNTNNSLIGSSNTQVNTKLILKPFRVPPLPEKALKIVPELKQWEQSLQIAIDRIRMEDANAIRGGI